MRESVPPAEPVDRAEPRANAAGATSDEPCGSTLYVVGTPIGNLEDLSPRARRVLERADRIACEDTRHSGLLLSRLGIRGRRLLSFHAHNEAARMPQLLEALAAGEAVAVISDFVFDMIIDKVHSHAARRIIR